MDYLLKLEEFSYMNFHRQEFRSWNTFVLKRLHSKLGLKFSCFYIDNNKVHSLIIDVYTSSFSKAFLWEAHGKWSLLNISRMCLDKNKIDTDSNHRWIAGALFRWNLNDMMENDKRLGLEKFVITLSNFVAMQTFKLLKKEQNDIVCLLPDMIRLSVRSGSSRYCVLALQRLPQRPQWGFNAEI